MSSKNTAHTRRRYDLIAPLYNLMEWPVEKLLFQKWRNQLWDQIHGPKVLEIGIGTGKNIPYYPKNVNITGIDLSPAMLKRAKKLLPAHEEHIQLREMDAQQMDFLDDTFDDVVATFVFCSVPDPVQGLKEALRVTKPGGKLQLLEHMRANTLALARIMDKLDAPLHYLSGVHIARQTVANVKKAGWEIEQDQDLTAKGIFKRIEASKPLKDHHTSLVI